MLVTAMNIVVQAATTRSTPQRSTAFTTGTNTNAITHAYVTGERIGFPTTTTVTPKQKVATAKKPFISDD